MEILYLYYSVSNGGDGSAYPNFFESEELAEWHQDHLEDGWGESCTGVIEVTSDSIITCGSLETAQEVFDDMISEVSYYDVGANRWKDEMKDIVEFISLFEVEFPKGFEDKHLKTYRAFVEGKNLGIL